MGVTPYVAIDIESTGLDEERDQVLEIACVYDDWVTDPSYLPVFHTYVEHGKLRGDLAAFVMNAGLLERMYKLDRPDHPGRMTPTAFLQSPENAARHLTDWFRDQRGAGDRLHLAGKNIGRMDFHFIKRLDRDRDVFKHCHHRMIDIGSVFWIPGMPVRSMAELMVEHGLGDQDHTALGDCLNVVRLMRIRSRKLACQTKLAEIGLTAEALRVNRTESVHAEVASGLLR